VLFASKKLESFEDSKAPPSSQAVRGGTRVLSDQAACPFRAFARWRLAAEELEEPAPGWMPQEGFAAASPHETLWVLSKIRNRCRKTSTPPSPKPRRRQ